MEYDFETGPEDEVIEREEKRARKRFYSLPGGIGDVIAPLVRLILALLAALGARTAQEALERINAMKIARDEARREVETKRQHVVSMVESYDRMREQLDAASAEIAQLTAQRDELLSEATAVTNQISDMHRELARLKSVPLTEQDPAATCPVHDPPCIKRCGSGPLTSPEMADPNAPADAAVQAYQPTVEITPATLDVEASIENPLAAQRLPTPETRSVTDPEDLLAMEHGAIPLEVRPACDECAATATKTGTTGTFCDAHADACSRVIEAADCASDPARVSLPATAAAAQALPTHEREAYYRGVEQGRREAMERPGGLVLVLEDGLPPAERARVAELCRSVRGVVATLPVADVVTKGDQSKRLAHLSAELISARATNEGLQRDVNRLTNLTHALRRQRKDARERLARQSGHDAADAGGIADAKDDDGLALRLRAGLDHLRIAADMARMQTPGGTAHLAVVAKDASGAGRVTATLEAAPFFADLETLLGDEPPPDSVDPRDLPPDSKCRNRLRGLTAQEIAAAAWTLEIGDRVRTVDPLTCGAYTDDSVRVRRAGAVGVIVRPLIPPAGDAVAWIVRHDDGTEAPYDADELLRAARDLPSDSGEPAPSIGAERESRLDFERRVMKATSAGAAVGLRRVMTEMGIGQQALAERLCVAVLVTDPAGRVALIESAKPGRAWEIPGGKVKEGETPRAAAVREVAEEMGVQLAEDALEPAGILRGTPKPGAQFASVIHVFRARAEGELRPGSDAKGAGWFSAHEAMDRALSDLQIVHDVLLPWAREQSAARAPDIAPAECVAVLATNAAGEVLLVRSRKGGDRRWELPGGKREAGEPVRLAAIREFAEETGLVVTLDEGEPVMLPPSARHRGALLFRGRAEGIPRARDDADMAAWWTAAQVLAAEDLSDLASRDALLAWAREQTGVQ